MRKLFLALLVGTNALIQGGQAQVPTQEQCQQADAQLNQVYQQLRGSLNDAQKQQLKQAQREWIKKRDAFVAQNSGNPQGALYQATMQRVGEIQGFIRQNSDPLKLQDSTKLMENSSNNDPTTSVHQLADHGIFLLDGLKNNQIYPSYQKVNWDLKGIVSEVVGEKLRCISTDEGPYVYIYDAKTKLFIGSIDCDAFPEEGSFSQGQVPWMLMLSSDESLLYFQRYAPRSPMVETFIVDTTTLKTVKKGGQYIPFFFKKDKNGYELIERPDISINNNITSCDRDLNDAETENAFNSIGETSNYNSKNKFVVSSSSKNIIDDSYSINNERIISSISKKDKISSEISLKEGVDNLKSRYLKERKAAFYLFEHPEKRGSWTAFWPHGLIYSIERDGMTFQVTYLQPNNDLSKLDQLSKSLLKRNITLFPPSIGAPYPASRKIIFGNQENNNTADINSFSIQPAPKQFTVNLKNPSFNFKWPLNPLDVRKRYSSGYCEFYGPDKDYAVYTTSQSCRIGSFPSFGILNTKNKVWLAATEGEGEALINLGSGLLYGNPYKGPGVKGASAGFYWSAKNDYGPLYSYDADNNSFWVMKADETNVLSSLYNIDASTGSLKSIIPSTPRFQAFSAGEKNLLASTDVSELKVGLWSRDPLNKIIDFYFGCGNGFVAITPDAYFIYNRDGARQVAFHLANKAFPLEQFDLRLNRPDIVLDRLGAPKEAIEAAKTLREKRLKKMNVTEEMLKPDFHLPELQIVGDVPAATSKDQVDIQIKASDDKFPLERLRVYVNNVPINGTEGESLRDQKTQSHERTIPIKLAFGRNKIQVSVLNSAGAESLYANAEVNCTAERPKPKLYAVALGVSQYDRPEWCLKYAAKDATDLINKLKAKAGSSYSEVKPLLLTDKEVTKESISKIKEFLSGTTIDDTVLIFMAGHGLLDDKYDYYFGTTDIDPAKPSERGMPYEAIDTILAEVPSLKKALLMDTCHAGELDDDEKKELATSDGKGTLPAASSTATDSAIKGTVAMRAIGTRGMQVKAVEGAKGKSDWYEKLQDMFVDLRRGSGATVISSSQGAEYAFESSEQSNGLFTYALMEAIDGKATPNKDGQITISAIGDYVKKRVQDLTKGKQNPNLRGVNLEEDFTLSSTK